MSTEDKTPDSNSAGVSEKTPIESKTVRAYLGVGLALITVIGFMVILFSHHSRAEQAAQHVAPPDNTATSVTPQSGMDQFRQDVNKEYERNQAAQQLAQERARQAREEQEQANRNVSPPSGRSALSRVLGESPEQKAREAFKVAEIKRSLMATHSGWGGVSDKKAAQAQASQATTTTVTHPMTMNDQLNDLSRRIAKLSQLKQEVNNGQYLSHLSATQQQDTQKQIRALESTFKQPPKGIVGYTTTNKYDADIAGKMKLPVGTVIPAITAMKTISDYTGPMKGIVTQDVYDPTYQYVLIPKGSEVIMKSVRISNVNEPISARMGLTVQWVVLPNGNRIDFSKSAGLDREGVAGLKDQVNYHFLAQFLGVAAYALVSNETSYQGSGMNADQTYAGNLGANLRKQFSPLAQKYLNLVPTITLKAGQSMNIILEDDIYLKPWKNIYKDYES